MSYDLLQGIRVLEVAVFAGDTIGQHLADMGAEVIKVETPSGGDYVRTLDPVSLGGPDGPGLKHLNWNRGKKSVALDLRQPEGRDVFLKLVKASDVVIEGLRAGALERWGVGPEVLRKTNPAVVICTLSGMGGSGPYRDLPTHGFQWDAYTGFAPPVASSSDSGAPKAPALRTGVNEYNTGGLYSAIGILAALIRAKRTGEGALIEVAQTEALAALRSEGIEALLNRDKMGRRAKHTAVDGSADSVRAAYYRTADDHIVLIMAAVRKFWLNFCRAVGREDLIDTFASDVDYDHAETDDELRREMVAIMRSRTLREWIDLFIRAEVPGGPVYTLDELVRDEHFRARENVTTVEHPRAGVIYLSTTPIRVQGQKFSVRLASSLGTDTNDILRTVAGLDEGELERLRASGAIDRSPASRG